MDINAWGRATGLRLLSVFGTLKDTVGYAALEIDILPAQR
jgi:hypothetical protein